VVTGIWPNFVRCRIFTAKYYSLKHFLSLQWDQLCNCCRRQASLWIDTVTVEREESVILCWKKLQLSRDFWFVFLLEWNLEEILNSVRTITQDSFWNKHILHKKYFQTDLLQFVLVYLRKTQAGFELYYE